MGNIKFTRAYVNTLKSISDDFASTLSKYDLTIEEFDAVRLTRYEFLNATAEEITNTFNTERELAGEEFADKPDLLAQKLRLIDDEYNIVMKQRQVLQNLTPEQRLTKYESLIALRNAYEAPDSDTLIIKCLSIDDAYNFLKENEAYGTIGGYVLKAGDTKAINTYDDLMATLRLDYINNPFERTPSKNFVEILYKTDKVNKITIPIEEGDPWPCTNKGFLANVNGEIVPEYYSPRLEPSEGEMYLVDGITGERTLIAVFDERKGVGRFIPINGSYWTEDLVKILKGE